MDTLYSIAGWAVVASVLPAIALTWSSKAKTVWLHWASRLYVIAVSGQVVCLVIDMTGNGSSLVIDLVLTGFLTAIAIDVRKRRDKAIMKEQAAYQDFLRQN